MTDTKNSLTYEVIEHLFQNSVCLTYNPLEPMSAWQYSKQLQQDFKKQNNVDYSRVCSKTSKMWQNRYNADFHFFSDGTLIHRCDVSLRGNEKLKQIEKIIEIKGWKIKKIYSPQEQMDFIYYSDFLRYISTQALLRYSYIEDLYIEALPSKEDFVKECFANGNILLTASKDEEIPSHCRDLVAIFADGQYYIKKNGQDPLGIKNNSQIAQIKHDYLSSYCHATEQVIPDDYFEALYIEAQKHDWYASKDYMDDKLRPHATVDDLIKMKKYIDGLFENRTCLTVVNPNVDVADFMFKSPDLQHYAVFSDGLVVSADFDENDKHFVKALKKSFPDLNLHFEKVPENYIKQLYKRLPEFQKSAATIYIEMLKQKARKLKRISDLTHIEALDVVAKMSGWKDWRSIDVVDEMHARKLISLEKRHKHNSLEDEYKRYLMLHK